MGGHHRFIDMHDCFESKAINTKEEVDHGLTPLKGSSDLVPVHQHPRRVLHEEIQQHLSVPGSDGLIPTLDDAQWMHGSPINDPRWHN